MQHSSKPNNSRDSSKPSFNELLQKQCPWHPHHKHSAWDCFSLLKAMMDASEPPGAKDKGNAKEDEHDGDNRKFQNPSNIVNFIFGGTPGTATMLSQMLTLREIM